MSDKKDNHFKCPMCSRYGFATLKRIERKRNRVGFIWVCDSCFREIGKENEELEKKK